MAFVINAVGIDITATVGAPTAEHIVPNTFMNYMDADLDSVFFNNTEFAEKKEITYKHKIGDVAFYYAIFDDPTTNANLGGDSSALLQKPHIMIKEKIMKHTPNRGDELIVKGVRYAVDTYISNGVGIMTLFLNRTQ